METSVDKTAKDAYRVSLGGRDVELSAVALKNLLLQITRALLPSLPEDADDPGSPEETRTFLARLGSADDLGIQALLRNAEHADLVALLKIAEGDPALLDRFYKNMSAKARKMYAEDIDYTFRDKAPGIAVHAAVARVKHRAQQLERSGALRFGA